MRIVVIGNAGGGKSTLARKLATELDLPVHEVDRLLWRPGWVMTPADEYEDAHAQLLDGDLWIIEGMGRRQSIAARIERATHVVLCDFPLWQHFWIVAERQLAWSRGELEHPPAGGDQMPPTRAIFELVWTVEQDWMPLVREKVAEAERNEKDVRRIPSFEDLQRFEWAG
ncbi:MAG: adenylate kinase [Pseudomonadota bacterium]